VNVHDTSVMQEKLSQHGYKLTDENAEIQILNTCAVTQEATKEAVRTVRKLKRKNPNAKIIVVGCGAQIDSDQFIKYSNPDSIVGNSHKGNIENILREVQEGKNKLLYHSNIFKITNIEQGIGMEKFHSRSFLKIQDGCNSFCTYCVIPYTRGKSRSLNVKFILDSVTELEKKGIGEVVLTGIHLGDYCGDQGDKNLNLSQLVEKILNCTNTLRIRLSSLEPPELSDSLLDQYSNSRLCPHFHMSIQSLNDEILKKMKRNYKYEDIERILTKIKLKLPFSFIGMDIITGFCGETLDQFRESCEKINQLHWTKLHVFPYSERPNTFANKFLDSVSLEEKKRRSKILRNLSYLRTKQEAQEQIGKVKKVLWLNSKDKTRALSDDNWNIWLSDSAKNRLSNITKLKIIDTFTNYPNSMDVHLLGSLAES